jgi:hypothetical protein
LSLSAADGSTVRASGLDPYIGLAPESGEAVDDAAESMADRGAAFSSSD